MTTPTPQPDPRLRSRLDAAEQAATELPDTAAPPAFNPTYNHPNDPTLDAPAVPLSATDEDQIAEARQREEASAPGLIEGAEDAIKSEWSLYWMMGGRDTAPPDANFRMDPETFKAETKDIPEDNWGYLQDARSADDFKARADAVRRDLQLQQDLGKMGLTGVGLRLTTSLIDPVSLGATAISEGALAPLLMARKVGRLANAARAALTSGAAGLATEGVLEAVKPTAQPIDLLYAGLGSMALGGVVGGAFPKGAVGAHENEMLTALAAKGTRDIEAHVDGLLRDAGVLNMKTADTLRRSATNTTILSNDSAAANKLLDNLAEIQANASGWTGIGDDGLDSVGAARVASPYAPISENAAEELQRYRDTPRTAMPAGRYDVLGHLGSSEHPLARRYGYLMGEDAVGNADGSPTLFSATEYQHMLETTNQTRWMKEVGSAYRQYADTQGWNWLDRIRNRHQFMEEVTRIVRTGATDAEPELVEAAGHMRRYFDEYLDLAQRPGRMNGMDAPAVRGFPDVEPNPNYVPRFYNFQHLSRLISEFGHANVTQLVRGAIQAANPEIEDAVAQRLARWHVDRLRRLGVGADLHETRALTGEDYDGLREMLLNDADSGYSTDDVESIINILRKPAQGGHSRSKRRALMDEDYSTTLTPSTGVGAREVRLDELFENNAEELYHRYNRQMSGAIGLARAGFDSRAQFERALNHIKLTAPEIEGYTANHMDSDLKRLEFLYSALTGRPYWRTATGRDVRSTRYAQVLKLVRDYNFARVMGQVGIAQVEEFGKLIGTVGVRTALSAFPAMRGLWRNARTGQLGEDVLNEIEAIWGIGTDRLRGLVWNAHDETHGFATDIVDTNLRRVDNVLRAGKQFVSDASLMGPINTMLHRWSAKAIVHKFTEMAYGGKGWGDKRLASLGLSREMADRIGAQIREHSTVEEGMTGRHIRRINLDDWADIDAAESFRMGVNRAAKRVVQENNPGNMAMWMTHPIGQTIAQFRNFLLVSHHKQLLAGLHLRDRHVFGAFLGGMVAAGMGYIAQSYVNSFGREDRDEYLERMLNPEAIGAAAFQRVGWSSFAPMAVSTVGSMFLDDPIFDYRSSGLSTSLWGNPSWSMVDGTVKSLQALGHTAVDPNYRLSKQNIRDAWSLLPLQNAFVMRNLMNAATAGLPDRSMGN